MSPFTKKRLSSPQTLGEKLVRARKRKRIDLRTAERETRVAMKHLQALERGHYHSLPATIYTRGFLTRYAAYLGMKPDAVLADCESEMACYTQAMRVRRSKQSEEGLLRPHVADEWLKNPNRLMVTPGMLWGTTLSTLMLGILGYVWFQVASFAAAPPLEIVTPGSELRVAVQEVEVSGMTDPTAALAINGQSVAVDDAGRFRQAVSLIDGVNTLEITATNKAEKETSKTIQLLADIPVDDVAIPETGVMEAAESADSRSTPSSSGTE